MSRRRGKRTDPPCSRLDDHVCCCICTPLLLDALGRSRRAPRALQARRAAGRLRAGSLDGLRVAGRAAVAQAGRRSHQGKRHLVDPHAGDLAGSDAAALCAALEQAGAGAAHGRPRGALLYAGTYPALVHRPALRCARPVPGTLPAQLPDRRPGRHGDHGRARRDLE